MRSKGITNSMTWINGWFLIYKVKRSMDSWINGLEYSGVNTLVFKTICVIVSMLLFLYQVFPHNLTITCIFDLLVFWQYHLPINRSPSLRSRPSHSNSSSITESRTSGDETDSMGSSGNSDGSYKRAPFPMYRHKLLHNSHSLDRP